MRAQGGQAEHIWAALDALHGERAITSQYLLAASPAGLEGLRPFTEKSTLLKNPDYMSTCTWLQMRELVPKPATPTPPRVSPETLRSLLAIKTRREFDTAAKLVWPARTKKDLSLRRSRMFDYVKIIKGYYPALLAWMSTFLTAWSYIFVTNLLLVLCVYGDDWFKKMSSISAFAGTEGHYIACAKVLNDVIKTRGLDDPHWQDFAEAATLTGYRNKPFPGFDEVAETRLLAAGGNDRHLFGRSFDALTDKYLSAVPKPLAFVTFEAFVLSGDWVTAGSSTEGKIEVTLPDGTTKKIKARKNNVPDVIDLSDLAVRAQYNIVQTNRAFAKAELGKLRVAVAGDLLTYLQMSWINMLMNGAYKQWPGSTIEESFVTQTTRMAKMLRLCLVKYGLPFDYAGFDHQPLQSEIVTIWKKLCSIARLNVPYGETKCFDDIVERTVQGFASATVSVRDDNGAQIVFPVTGGLQSGLRITTCVGNAWNTIITQLAIELLNEIGLDTSTVERYIRGDDSAIFTDTAGLGSLIKAGYDIIGAKGGEGKFSLQSHSVEFLRVWYHDHCSGYPLRALPGLVQRKPWSSEPWSPDYVMRASFEVVKTLRRRSPHLRLQVDRVWDALANGWCRDHNVPRASFRASVHNGGFAIEGGANVTEVIFPRVKTSVNLTGLKINNQNSWRAKKIGAYFSERYSLAVDGDICKTIASQEMISSMLSDDVPELSRVARTEWTQAVKDRWYTTVVHKEVHQDLVTTDVNAYDLEDTYTLGLVLASKCPDFGACPELKTAVVDYHALGDPGTLTGWIDNHYPVAAAKIKRFHHSWYKGEIIDYLSGTLPIVANVLHPALNKFWQMMVAANFLPRRRVKRESLAPRASAIETMLYQSSLSQKIYNW